MAWTSYQLFLSFLLVITGSLNTLTTKWADKITAKSSDGHIRNFNHPFTQALVMFLGEILCIFTFLSLRSYYSRRHNFNPEHDNPLIAGNENFKASIFYIPAVCDMVATSLMYVGLTLTYASSFQMLRGSLIAFVALLSYLFLGKALNSRQCVGIVFIIFGLVVVGLADFFNMDSSTSLNNVITGDILIVMGQLISAIQMVYEQHYVNELNVPPLLAVGWEGIFGFVTLAIIHIPMYFIYVGSPFSNNPRGVIEDFPDAMTQIANNPMLLLPIIGTIISIAFFNFASISITKEISASTRSVLDSVRTLFIWLATLALGWQAFAPIQILGFVLLVLGMCIYNDILVTTTIRAISTAYSGRSQPRQENLINEEADHHDDLESH